MDNSTIVFQIVFNICPGTVLKPQIIVAQATKSKPTILEFYVKFADTHRVISNVDFETLISTPPFLSKGPVLTLCRIACESYPTVRYAPALSNRRSSRRQK